MEIVRAIIENWTIGLLGAALFIFFKIWNRLKELRGDFDWGIFWSKHKDYLIAILVLHLLVAITLEVLPETEQLVATIFSFDFEKSRMGYFWLGILLSGGTNWVRPGKNISDA